MSYTNWATILNIPGGPHYEAVKWITYQINGFDIAVMNEEQYEHVHGLVAELRKLLEDYCKIQTLDDFSKTALREEIEGIRSGDPMYWSRMLAAIKAVYSNPTEPQSYSPSKPYSESVSQHHTFSCPVINFGRGINNEQPRGYHNSAYSSVENNLINHDNKNLTPGLPPGTMDYGNSYPKGTDSHHLTYDASFYSPGSSSNHSCPSPMTSSQHSSISSSEMNYDFISTPKEYMVMEVDKKVKELTNPTYTTLHSHSSREVTGQSYVLTSIQNEITDVLNDIKRWNLEEENRQRDTSLLERLDHQFLNSIETKSNRIVTQLLSIQTPEAVKMLESFVPNLLTVIKQPERVVQYKERFSTTVRLFLGANLTAVSPKCNVVSVKVINEEKMDPLEKGLGGLAEGKLESAIGNKGNGLIADLHPTIPKNPRRLNKANNTDMLRVHDECFYLQYSVKVKLQGYGKPILASTYSHPFKITVNSKQDSYAWETVIWDNAAGRFGILPCRTRPQSLKFIDIVKAINAYFADSGHSLQLRDFEVVFGLIYPSRSPRFMSRDGEEHITLAQFRVEQEVSGLNLDLRDARKISFWAWFFYLKKFIMTYIRDLWSVDGFVMGYLTQAESRLELSNQCEGAFLIRLSNSTPNAVTVEWNDPGGIDKKSGIYSYRGSCTDLTLRSLKDRIADTPRWKVHHPSNYPKETMFQHMPDGFTSERKVSEEEGLNGNIPRIVGYVKAVLQQRLDF